MPPALEVDLADSQRPPRLTDRALTEEELAAQYWDRVRLFALRRVRDPAAAEDVAQEAMRVVGEALRNGRVENLHALPGFVFRTAQHLCLRRFRALGREAKALSRLGADTPSHHREDPLVDLIAQERRGTVRRAFDALTPGDRQLLTFLYYEEIDIPTAATRLGITPDALRVRKHRALRRLGVLLGEESEDVTP